MDIRIDDIVKKVIEEHLPYKAVETTNVLAAERLNIDANGRTAVLENPQEFTMKTWAIPTLQKDEVLVKVEAGLVTAADVAAFLKENKAVVKGIGAQGTGVVVKLGSEGLKDAEDKTLVVGDEVISLRKNDLSVPSYNRDKDSYKADSWFGSYIVLKAGKGILAVNDLDQESRLLAEPVAAVCKALENARKVSDKLNASNSVVVAGCTLTGFITMALLKCMGVGRVIAIGGDDAGIRMAQKFGADEVINYADKGGVNGVAAKIQGLLGGRLADVVFYCSGSDMGKNFAKKLLAQNGYLCDFGFVHGKVGADSRYYEDTMPLGGRYYTIQDYKKAVEFLKCAAAKNFPIYQLVTQRYNLDQIDEAFWASLRNEGLAKAVLNR